MPEPPQRRWVSMKCLGVLAAAIAAPFLLAGGGCEKKPNDPTI